MKTLEFIYQETQIHFLVNPLDKNVMVNATEMAKLFDRRTKDFLKTDHAKDFIEVAKRALNGAQIIEDRGRNGIFFNKRLALKFAAWLNPEFEYWVFSTIDEIVFGNYQKTLGSTRASRTTKSIDGKHQKRNTNQSNSRKSSSIF